MILYNIVNAIKYSEKKMTKLHKINDIWKLRKTIMNMVIGECAVQNIKVTEEDIFKTSAYIEVKCM